MEVVVKAYLQNADGNVEVRRIPISTVGQTNNKGIFQETLTKVGNAFPGLVEKVFSLKWKDSDGDLVMMSSNEEMLEALSQSPNSPLKLFISVEGVKETSFEILDTAQADVNQEPKSDSDKVGDHQRQDPNIPFSPPSEFCFPDPMSFFGMGGMKKRGHPDSHNPRGHFGNLGSRGHHFDIFGSHGHFNHLGPRGHPFSHLGPRGHHFDHHSSHGHHFGPFGHQFDNLGPRGHHFGHLGPRGHHFDGMGPRGHHFGHLGPRGNPCHRGGHQFGNFMGMHCQFERPDFYEGQQPGADMFFGHHFGKHHGHHHKHHHEENGWKANLRDAVPVAHRRWAKAYIRSWRFQNLTNATSTSSDTDQEILTMEAASVPEAYAAWLDIILIKWHKSLGKESAVKNDKEKISEEKHKLKSSVPLEFRKWAKWYLARHFGKKDAPKFRKDGHFETKLKKLEKKDWKKSFKMETLAVTIPSEHRLWAKTFIRDWRQEQNVPDPRPGDNVFSESEDTEKKTTESFTVPPDYVKWMRLFLTQWHLLRGQIDGQNVQIEDEKGQFKETVPKNFRKWVKCFLWRRYGKGAEKEEGNNLCQYEKWLQAFQNKWLQEQSKEGNGDKPFPTSSDEDATEQEMESSLKKLRLGHDSASRMMFDSEDEQNPGFSHWFKQALWQWDGRTAPGVEQEGATDIEQMPPSLYNWMAKKMMKMQRKRMKQEFKHAKHSMKAAMKAHRHGYF